MSYYRSIRQGKRAAPPWYEQLMRETITIPDAAVRYSISAQALRRRLRDTWRWRPTPQGVRYRIVDVEKVIEDIQAGR